jgi:hypothetical protein
LVGKSIAINSNALGRDHNVTTNILNAKMDPPLDALLLIRTKMPRNMVIMPDIINGHICGMK